MDVLYIDNDHFPRLKDFYNRDTQAFDQGATVTVRITDMADVDVDVNGAPAWPITMAYVAGTDAEYTGVIDKLVALVVDTQYKVKITAVSGSYNAFWDIPVIAKRRIQ